MATPAEAARRAVATRPLLADVVRDGLRRAVITGEYEPGSKLPNEDALAGRFAVSRATIREAVRGLVEEGYLLRRQGSGTYVTARPLLRNSLDRNFSYTAYLESTGVRGGRRILGVRTIPADEDVAVHLRLDVGSPVVELRRVRTADDRPAVYSIDCMPADVVSAERDREALGGSIYALLATRGHPVRHGEAVVAPAAADRDLAAVLEVAPGTLLQHLEQVDIDGAGRRVLYSLEWHVPSVIELRVYRRGPGLSEGDGRG
jgi:GntR family transcriptional regulator